MLCIELSLGSVRLTANSELWQNSCFQRHYTTQIENGDTLTGNRPAGFLTCSRPEEFICFSNDQEDFQFPNIPAVHVIPQIDTFICLHRKLWRH